MPETINPGSPSMCRRILSFSRALRILLRFFLSDGFLF
jgi:hypothetical protein